MPAPAPAVRLADPATGGSASGHGSASNRSGQVLWAAIVACLVGLLVGCTAKVTGSNAADASTLGVPSEATPADGVSLAPLRVLQLNLCNSGIAGCYTGRSTAEAAAVIRAEMPDVVTLNEICQTDLSNLQGALADVWPTGEVVSAFRAALDRRTGDVFRCSNGQPYGIGLVSRWPSIPGSSAVEGIYPTQDIEDPEERAWLCLGLAAEPTVTMCTTHLAYTKRNVTAAQCGYLFGAVITRMRDRDPAVPVVLGGDLNLGSGDSADLRSCLPAGSAMVDDGGVQHVVATPEFDIEASQRIDLRGTTDHPGLLVTLTPHVRR